MIHPKSLTGILSSSSATSAPHNSDNHACCISANGDVESVTFFGNTILEDDFMDMDSTTWHQSIQSSLIGTELL
jgi:hypothetical protein